MEFGRRDMVYCGVCHIAVTPLPKYSLHTYLPYYGRFFLIDVDHISYFVKMDHFSYGRFFLMDHFTVDLFSISGRFFRGPFFLNSPFWTYRKFLGRFGSLESLGYIFAADSMGLYPYNYGVAC